MHRLKEVRLERRGRVGIVTLDRRRRLNVFNASLALALDEVISEIAADTDIGAVVVTGSGRAFCAGADIEEISTLADQASFADFIDLLAQTFTRLQELPKPSVAAINGAALGGGLELALACDLRVAADRARLGVPEIKLGLLPGAGATARLTRLLPQPVAKYLLLTGESISADEALRYGLVCQVVNTDAATTDVYNLAVVDSAVALADKMASFPAAALAGAKALVDEGSLMALGAAIKYERQVVSGLFGAPDRAEGITAFLQKRPAHFHVERPGQ